MKCAVIISGQPRGVEESFENISDKIIKPNNADVFIHTWIDRQMFGRPYYSAWLYKHRELLLQQGGKDFHIGPSSNPIPHNIESIILDLYNPKKHMYESPKIFKYDPILDQIKSPSLNPQDGISQLYSMYMANMLKKEYEEENNFVYDIVVRIRFGLIFWNKFPPLSDFAGSRVCFIPIGFSGFNRSDSFLSHTSICDHWAISSSEIMNIYTDVYNQIEFLVKNKYCHFQCEDLIGSHLRKYRQIQVALIDQKYSINVLSKMNV
jgi:hypothetical protein